MRRLAILLIALVLGPAPSTVAADVILRTSVTPEEAWVGQRVILRIDVLGDNGWAQIPKIGSVDVPGAFVIRTESQGTRLQETIGGVSYSGQRYELSLYPQRGGPVKIPALPVTVTIRTWGVDAEETVQQANTPGTTFTCKVPPGAEGIRGLISTTRLTASQTWEPDTDNLNVGDAIKRTIVLQASDVSGMAFAPMQHPAIDRLGIYPGEPTVEDASARGAVTGTRTETVTYVFEGPGEIEIPAIVLPWWDVGANELKRIELPGRALQVAGTPTTESGPGTQAGHQQNTLLLLSALIAIAAVAVFALRLRGNVMARWSGWRRARNESEAIYFRRLMSSLRSGDSKATLCATMRWLDRINDDLRPARLDVFLRQYGDNETQEAADHLAHSIASGQDIRDVSALKNGLASARNRWRKAPHAKDHASALLPEINGVLRRQ